MPNFKRFFTVIFTPIPILWLTIFPVMAIAGEYDPQITEYQKIVESDPSDVDAAYRLGNYLAWDLRYEEAIRVFQKILQKVPEYKEAEIGIARVYAWKGDQAMAEKKFQEVLVKYPGNFDALQGIGSLYLWSNDFERSIRYFKRALEKKPEDVTTLKGLGRAYVGRGDRRTAEQYFSRAQWVELKKTPISRLLLYGVGLLSLGFLAIVGFRIFSVRRRKEILHLELKVIRATLLLYYQKKGHFPLALENLLHEKWRPPGDVEEKVFLEGMRQGDRDFLVDPFYERYYYNPNTGRVNSTTRGCEEW